MLLIISWCAGFLLHAEVRRDLTAENIAASRFVYTDSQGDGFIWDQFGSGFDHDPLSRAHVRIGTQMPTPESLGTETFFPYTYLTPTPYDETNDSLFFARDLSGVFEFVDLSGSADWSSTPLARVPSLDLPAQGTTRLYRRHVFEPANLEFLEGRTGNLRGARKLIILIHGWNPGSSGNSYSRVSSGGETAWGALIRGLEQKVAEVSPYEDWRLAAYHWEGSADTGPVFPDGVSSASEAAEIAHVHGWYLGELLADLTIGDQTKGSLEAIQIVAHSAGSWAARSAAYYIANAYERLGSPIDVQVTLLDAFVPGASAVGIQSQLDESRMDGLQEQLDLVANYTLLENYWDKNDDVVGTQEAFLSWAVPGERTGGDVDPIKSHAAPIHWYGLSVINPATDPETGAPWDGTRAGEGFRHSLLYRDLVAIKYPDVPASLLSTRNVRFRNVAAGDDYCGFLRSKKGNKALGRFEALVLRSRRGFSATMVLGNTSYAIKGRFGKDGRFSKVITPESGLPATVELQLVKTAAGSYKLKGNVKYGNKTAKVVVVKAGDTGAQAGSYTLLIPGEENQSTAPQGHGHGTMELSANGYAKILGTLGDSKKWTAMCHVTGEGEMPLYSPLYRNGSGWLAGMVRFRDMAGVSDCDGVLHWRKQGKNTGFSLQRNVVGSRYHNASATTGPVSMHAYLGAGASLDPVSKAIEVEVNAEEGRIGGTIRQAGTDHEVDGVLFPKQGLAAGIARATGGQPRSIILVPVE